MASDDVAVYWNQYDSVKSSIEYEFRFKLVDQLERLIREAESAGMETNFISGMQHAKGLVQGLILDPLEKEKLNHPSLF
jgi:hypothetical protein